VAKNVPSTLWRTHVPSAATFPNASYVTIVALVFFIIRIVLVAVEAMNIRHTGAVNIYIYTLELC
jgi:hypothetical protein